MRHRPRWASSISTMTGRSTTALAHPFNEDVFGSGTDFHPQELGLGAAVYFGGIALTAFLPKPHWWLKLLAWFWPLLAWLSFLAIH